MEENREASTSKGGRHRETQELIAGNNFCLPWLLCAGSTTLKFGLHIYLHLLHSTSSFSQGQYEKNALLKGQVDLLEDQVIVLTEELGIFRQLGIYHSTLDHQFKQIREKKQQKLRLGKSDVY